MYALWLAGPLTPTGQATAASFTSEGGGQGHQAKEARNVPQKQKVPVAGP